MQRDLSGLEKKIGYSFKDKDLLIKALTHRSYEGGAEGSNERLEYLGDSVLGLCIAKMLYEEPSGLSEAVMSKIKANLVSETSLKEIAESISIGDYLRLGKGEEGTGGRKKKSLISDALEALIGAIYLDGGLSVVENLTKKLFKERASALIEKGHYSDPKSMLQEKSQMLFGSIPKYRVGHETGEPHKKIFSIDVYINGKPFGSGMGRSKKEAEVSAAKEALKKLS